MESTLAYRTRSQEEISDEKVSSSPDIPQSEKPYLDENFEDHDVTKPFPIDPDEIVEDRQLSFRAVVVGCALGAVVGASNIYLGLKTGFTFGPQLFGAIFGYAIVKALSKSLPESGILGWLGGGPFGPKENCTVQSAATASGGLGILFVSAIPAMYRMELLSPDPSQDIGKLIALTACAGFFGVFFVIPLRKYYIVKQKLTFPTPAATAYTIRSLHNGRTGAITAKKKSLGLLYTFVSTFVFKVATGYAPGVLYDWHIGWTLYRLGFSGMIHMENYGWILEFTPAFLGAGMLSGLNASWSFFGGSVLAWGIIAPALVKNGKAFGTSISDDYPLVSYIGLSFKDPGAYVEKPSPRYWLLWPGVLIMLVYSFADIFITLIPLFKQMDARSLNPVSWFRSDPDEVDEDLTPVEDRIPLLWWTSGLAISTIGSCAILATLFHFNVGEAILSLILGFLFSFIGVQSSGYTDVNPVSTVAKASQLIFGGITKASGLALKPAQTLNLTAGVVAAGSAAQASDMTGDLKTGYLLRAKPRVQFVAQLCGSVVAVFLCTGLFILFVKASPCILTGDTPCQYAAPSINAWAAVAVAVTSPKLPIPSSSGYTAIGLAIASVLTLVIRNFFIPKKYWGYVPNWNAIGLAFVVPQIQYSIAMAIGSILTFVWLKRSPVSYDMYMFPISAGLLAGEGLGGVFQALLAIIGVDGSKYGTAIGCPGMEFCG
ncbi:OPT oligopeptide transporter [Crepidotus variabilis]|uniref:OPT oligopeptide transporter n=1 Tax=Crepidotus variabilis TaxID=179855 RepID=A0A9P6JMC4_9AGAR|nr:OPT oligopeptide transporter [Crepidotus variabilis]